MLTKVGSSKISATHVVKRNFSKQYKNFVNGQWVTSSATEQIKIMDPTNCNNVIGQVP